VVQKERTPVDKRADMRVVFPGTPVAVGRFAEVVASMAVADIAEVVGWAVDLAVVRVEMLLIQALHESIAYYSLRVAAD